MSNNVVENVVPLFPGQPNAIDIFEGNAQSATAKPDIELNPNAGITEPKIDFSNIVEDMLVAVEGVIAKNNLGGTQTEAYETILDKTLVSEAMTAMILRMYGQSHPLQKLTDEIVQCNIVSDTHLVLDINYDILTDLLEEHPGYH